MYLRFVQVNILPDSLSIIRDIYDREIIPRLQSTAGCLFACLIVSDQNPDEAISMTLWDSQKHADDYEKSDFQGLYNKIQPYTADSTAWKIELLKEQKPGEYESGKVEPVITSYHTTVQPSKRLPEQCTAQMLLRIYSIKIQQGKLDEFKKIYSRDILPVLRKVKGCLYAHVTESHEDHEVVSVTIWDSKKHADEYVSSGTFRRLNDMVKHTFDEIYQWKMTLDKSAGKNVVTSADPSLEYFKVLTSKSFT
jgi:quinol monooxygenase YgiN